MAAPLLAAARSALAQQIARWAAVSSASGRRRGPILAACGGCIAAAVLLVVAAAAAVVALRPGPSGGWSPPMRCASLHASQGFGDTPWEHPHTGIDLVCPAGTPVLAVAAGLFSDVLAPPVPCAYPPGMRGGLGRYGVLDLGAGTVVLYGHLAAVVVPEGPVAVGQVLGVEGASGCASGPHLHFEVDVGGRPVNPCPFLPLGYPDTHVPGPRCWGAVPP